jgi:hypothetical protein
MCVVSTVAEESAVLIRQLVEATKEAKQTDERLAVCTLPVAMSSVSALFPLPRDSLMSHYVF